MKSLEDDVWISKNDIPDALEAFKNWLKEDNTWENVLDGCDKYAVAEMAVSHFINDLIERIRLHEEEHKKLQAEFDRLQKDFHPVCTYPVKLIDKGQSICCGDAEKERGEPWRCEKHRGK